MSVSFSLYFSLVEANPDVTMDCIIHMSQSINPAQRATLLNLLAAVDNTSTN